jgi:hypothetical protein
VSPVHVEANGTGMCPPCANENADRQQQGWHAALNAAATIADGPACESASRPASSAGARGKRGQSEGGAAPESKTGWSIPSENLSASELDKMQMTTCAAVQPGTHDLLL